MKKTTLTLINSTTNFFKSIFAWMLDHKLWSAILFAILFGGLYFFLKPSTNTGKTEEITVSRKNLEESVSLTGRVKPVAEASVTFEKSGTVRNITVKPGDKVYKGQTLATLSADDVYARVAEAQANLDAQKAVLADLTSGAKEEQINLKKVAIERAQNDIDQAYRNIDDTLRNIAIAGNDIVRVNYARIFDGSYATTYRININSCDSNLESITSNSRKTAEDALIALEAASQSYASLASVPEKDTAIQNVKTQMSTVAEFLNQLKSLYSSPCLTSITSHDATRSTISANRSTWSSLTIDLSSKISLIKTQNLAMKQAQEDLRLLESGEKSEKIRQQEAQVSASRARLAQAASEAAKNSLRAPFNGVVTAVDLKAGEYASIGGTKSISLISDASFEIESKVSEVDVAKIKVNDKAQVTFDAYGDEDLFEAIITNISPAGVITEGVPTYKTIFSFTEKSDKIRSGMTANIDVVTKIHEGVLAIPARAVKNTSGVKTVKVLVNKEKNETKDATVTTGARGVSGEVEILTGLSEGDIIIIEGETK